MTRKELWDKIREAVEEDFQPGKRRPDGTFRPHLTPEDLDQIVDRVYSTIGRSGLGIGVANEDGGVDG
ncbi:hypothetical protein [Methylobacterium sp. J-077]|uniref:hypothetical protein n=1 Tax=Methylobacterium sp. J-077 TaxID=2836656 RepID=UPI001FBA16FA|nr:hypothetical protein [Methylobacterium sp. J-077]MCJ2126671.1 hypothetical protein [Methylobacterium sp. J-077]